MTKKDKELILFWLNKKAVDSHKSEMEWRDDLYKESFHRGQYQAYNEIYSMITNMHAEDET